jgi:mannose-6-phosphate isomerase-like protein (cupin superfamily)
MKMITRRSLCSALPVLATAGVIPKEAWGLQTAGLAVASSQGKSQASPGGARAGTDAPLPDSKASPSLAVARVFTLDEQPVRTMPNGGESRDIVRGTLATGESVNLHPSMQLAGATPNPPHVIQHSEFILVREGELEFEHELDGKMVSEKVAAGGVIYVAYGTRHTVKNVGNGPARYFVVAIGGDAH